MARLVKIAADKIRENQNLKLVVGVECLIVKPREDEETEKTIHAHTMPESVYSEDAVDNLLEAKRATWQRDYKQESIIRWGRGGRSNESSAYL